MVGEISTLFLIFAIFFPRITLLVTYIQNGIPPNIMHFWADFFMTLFLPRILIAIYCYTLGYGVWGTVFLVLGILETMTVTTKTTK